MPTLSNISVAAVSAALTFGATRAFPPPKSPDTVTNATSGSASSYDKNHASYDAPHFTADDVALILDACGLSEGEARELHRVCGHTVIEDTVCMRFSMLSTNLNFPPPWWWNTKLGASMTAEDVALLNAIHHSEIPLHEIQAAILARDTTGTWPNSKNQYPLSLRPR